MTRLPELITGRELRAFEDRRDRLVGQGVPDDLATRVAVLNPAYTLLGTIETADREGIDPADVARLHFALGERLGLPALVQRILALPARRPLADHGPRRRARRPLLRAHPAHREGPPLDLRRRLRPRPDRAWEDDDAVVVGRAVQTLEEICADDSADLARMSVGLRVVRGLLATG